MYDPDPDADTDTDFRGALWFVQCNKSILLLTGAGCSGYNFGTALLQLNVQGSRFNIQGLFNPFRVGWVFVYFNPWVKTHGYYTPLWRGILNPIRGSVFMRGSNVEFLESVESLDFLDFLDDDYLPRRRHGRTAST